MNIFSIIFYPNLQNLEEENLGIIYTHDKKAFITVKELVQISKANNSKFRTLGKLFFIFKILFSDNIFLIKIKSYKKTI